MSCLPGILGGESLSDNAGLADLILLLYSDFRWAVEMFEVKFSSNNSLMDLGCLELSRQLSRLINSNAE